MRLDDEEEDLLLDRELINRWRRRRAPTEARSAGAHSESWAVYVRGSATVRSKRATRNKTA